SLRGLALGRWSVRAQPRRLRRHLAQGRSAGGRVAVGRSRQRPPAGGRGGRNPCQRVQGLRPAGTLHRPHVRRGFPAGAGRGNHAEGLRRRPRLVGHHRAGQGAHRVPPVRSRHAGTRRRGRRRTGRQHRRHLAARRAFAAIPRWRAVRGARRPGRGRAGLARHRRRAGPARVRAQVRTVAMSPTSRPVALVAGVLLALLAATPALARDAQRAPEPNTLVPAGDLHYAPGAFPDRIVATPAQDASTGFSVAWRTGEGIRTPVLEITVAGDSPDMGVPRRVPATTRPLHTENGLAHHHRADVDGLAPDTLYAWRVQGAGGWWSPWRQLRTAGPPGTPLVLLYFGDTQNKNASLVSRVAREALRHAPDARLAIYTGDQVSGGDGEDDNEWGEWFDANQPVSSGMLVAPAAGNHEYFEEFEDTPRERRVLGAHWPVSFALPGNGAPGVERTSY